MSSRYSPLRDERTQVLNWTSLNSDGDIITKADTLQGRRVLVTAVVKNQTFSSTNFLTIRVQHSDEENSGYVDIPKEYLDGSDRDGVIAEFKETTTISNGTDPRHVGVLSPKRWIKVRGDITGSLSNVRVGASVVVGDLRLPPE